MKHLATRSAWIATLIVAACLLFQPEASRSQDKMGVARIWEGKISVVKADEYARYLMDAGVPLLKGTAGNLGVQVLRRNNADMVQFTVISYWTSREAIKKFAGEDIERAHALPRDPEFLLEPVTTVSHYQIIYNDTAKLSAQ